MKFGQLKDKQQQMDKNIDHILKLLTEKNDEDPRATSVHAQIEEKTTVRPLLNIGTDSSMEESIET